MAQPLLESPTLADGIRVVVVERGRVEVLALPIATNDVSIDVAVEKPAADAIVRRAFLMCASHQSYTITDGDILLDGAPVVWEERAQKGVGTESAFFNNVLAEVTDVVQNRFAQTADSTISLSYSEEKPALIDGCALYVIVNNPQVAETRTAVLLFGGLPDGDERVPLRLAQSPEEGAAAELGLAISYSSQGFDAANPHLCGTDDAQDTQIDINDIRLTSCAGSIDDGAPQNGMLLTVGGQGDSLDNPSDPFQKAGDSQLPRTTDDELYNFAPLLPSINTGINTGEEIVIHIDIVNPSYDDNLFASHMLLPGPAIAGEGILLMPLQGRAAVGAQSTISAVVQDEEGAPVVGQPVVFDIVAGPNSGVQINAETDADGYAHLAYSSDTVGTDSITATYVDSRGVSVASNTIAYTWRPGQYQLALSPPMAAHEVGDAHSAVAIVMDGWGNGVPAQLVGFRVRGIHELDASVVTGNDGLASFSYVGEATGSDQIDAWLDLNGNGLPDPEEPGDSAAVNWEPVTAIELLSFTAQRQGEEVHLQWETAAELDNAGFHLYRATSSDGQLVRIDEALIAAQGNGMGARYRFVDTPPMGAEEAAQYYYTLEDVDYYGVSTLHGPVSVEVHPADSSVGRTLYLPLLQVDD